MTDLAIPAAGHPASHAGDRPAPAPPTGARPFRTLVGAHARDLVRGRWLAAYAAVLALAADAMFRFTETPEQALLALSSVVLFVVPLVALTIGAMYVYAARDFTEVLLAQPLPRRSIALAQLAGFAAPVAAAALVGIVAPLLLHRPDGLARLVALFGGTVVVLTATFAAIAQLVALRIDDRVRGLGVALACWIVLALLYDGLILLVVASLGDYPIERPVLALMVLNPIDLARLTLLVELDGAALLGYTGAVFHRFLGEGSGLAAAAALLAGWVALPSWLATRAFVRKDF